MHVRWLNFLLHTWTTSALSLPQDAVSANISLTNSGLTTTALKDLVHGDCFTDPRLLPALKVDCLNAAERILEGVRYPYHPYYFARKRNVKFRLPKVVRHRTCVISLDVADDDEQDVVIPWVAYSTAIGLAGKCSRLDAGLGGKIFLGPKKVVYMIIFGRQWPTAGGEGEDGVNVAIDGINSMNAARREVNEGVPTKRNISSLASPSSSQEQITSGDSVLNVGLPMSEHQVAGQRSAQNTSVSILNGSPVMPVPTACYDPPLPRERLFPYDSSDCDKASQKIIGNRQKWDPYIFSRTRPAYSPRWYQMPATFSYKTCVFHLDMANDKDEDFVRVNYVEASAWVLAHKCSGEEVPQQKYGGYMTVGVGGSNNLIWVHVYGRPWPPRLGDHDMPSIPRNASVGDGENVA